MATIDDLNALNIRPRTIIRILIYDSNGTDLLLTITEEELIRATVSLRSDLSRINPTLPESDIEIEAYFETDISDVLADSDGLEIQYRWYPDGASTLPSYRYFYTDERITWSNKILHIHAVDQVHLLDEELPPIYIGQVWLGNTSISQRNVMTGIDKYYDDLTAFVPHRTRKNYLTFGNVDGVFSSIPDGGALNSLVPRMTRRESLAMIMSLFHWDFQSGELNNRSNYWPVYVDAGWPTMSNVKPNPSYTINMEDVGDFNTSKEVAWNEVNALVTDVEYSGYRLKENSDVSATMFKEKGLAMAYNGYIIDARFGLSQGWEGPNGVINSGWFYETAYQLFDLKERALPISSTFYPNVPVWMQQNLYGMWLLDDNPEVNPFSARSHTYIDLSGSKWTTTGMDGTVPGETPQSTWNDWITDGSIEATATDAELETRAHFFLTVNDHIVTKTKASDGRPLDLLDNPLWYGRAIMRKYDDTGDIVLLPDKGIESILNKSNVIGSFTWKGDPRMQPRDVFTFVSATQLLCNESDEILLTESGEELMINEGTSEVCTIETITITHEKGGTISEITYRKGIC